jgi:RIP metalloprotease RseP
MFALLAATSYKGTGLLVGQVEKNSLAQELGIKPSAVLTKINNQPLETNQQLKKELTKSETVCVTFIYKGDTLNKCGQLKSEKNPLLGVGTKEHTSFSQTIPKSFESIYTLTTLYTKAFVHTIYGLNVHELSGPIGIIDTMQQHTTNIEEFVQILILINIGLAAANLLFPLSITDGGRIVIDFFAILARRHTLPTKHLDFVCVLLMLCLFLTSTFMDIKRLIG